MKKKAWKLAAVMVAALLVTLVGVALSRVSTYRQPNIAEDTLPTLSYYITACYDEVERSLRCRQQVNWVLGGEYPLNDLVFHLYPNAFSDPHNLPAPKELQTERVLAGFRPGGIRVETVRINAQPVEYQVDGTILRLTLPREQFPGAAFTVELDFTLDVPDSRFRLGRANSVSLFGNWYPILAMLEQGQWRTDPYLPIGDPFYSVSADYTVEIDLPRGMQIVTSGMEVERRESADRVASIWRASAMRDFAWAASSDYSIISRESSGVLVTSAFVGDRRWGELALELAVESLERYSRLFGRYPYTSLTVAETGLLVFGGMEYPALIVLSPYGQRDDNVAEAARIEREVAHETAHQWWYASVGNDQIREPWLDESLATYSTTLYFADRYGPAELTVFRENRWQLPPKPVSSTIRDFDNWSEYYRTIYVKGAHLLDQLSLRIGQDSYLQLMNDYHNRFAGRVATNQDFIELLRVKHGADIAEWFAESLSTP